MCFKVVSWISQGSSIDLLTKFQRCFTKVSYVFLEYFMEIKSFLSVLMIFQDFFGLLSRLLREYFKGVSSEFEVCFEAV